MKEDDWAYQLTEIIGRSIGVGLAVFVWVVAWALVFRLMGVI